jgi:hypothetical protein
MARIQRAPVQVPGELPEENIPGDTTDQAAAEPAAAAPEAETSPAGLRAADVDPTKIKRAVLTADGWVCPDTVPAPPARQ